MGHPNAAEWCKLPTTLTELCVSTILRCGQSFRWRKSVPDEWSCALHGRLLTLRQDATDLHYRAIFPQTCSKKSSNSLPTPPPSAPASTFSRNGTISSDDTLDFIKHYLNLTPNLTALYKQWSDADPNFRKRVLADMHNLQGIRILRQDPWEALCGFISSSNNNIARISQMMNKISARYGQFIGELEEEVEDVGADSDTENVPPTFGETSNEEKKPQPKMRKVKIPYHDFPPPSALTAPDTEAVLRDLGFGYRAKYIYKTACVVANEKGGVQWLESLMNPDSPSVDSPKDSNNEDHIPPEGRPGYRTAHEALLELTGVGPKVADCVCLMGLGWGEAVPVDTHVWQIAVRDYKFGKGGKNATMTKGLYDAVGEKFRGLWGKEAGWAHSVLFTADLSAFKERTVKVEVKEEDEDVGGVVVKKEEVEEDGMGVVHGKRASRKRKPSKAEILEPDVKREVKVEKAVKQPWEEEENKTIEVYQDMAGRVKRRRRGGG